MALAHRFVFPALWLSWAGYWWLASRDVKPTARREPLLSRMLHVLPLVLAFSLLALPRSVPTWLDLRFIAWAEWEFWAGAALTAIGLLFTVWARIHLGRNWSGIVTVKQDHELVATGPYALVRHPIYSGLLLAFVGSALARGDCAGALAVLIASLALWRKWRLEERWMRQQFGDRYEAYRQRVSALVPFLF